MSLCCRQSQENCLGLSAHSEHWHEGSCVCRHPVPSQLGAWETRSSQLGHTQQEVLDFCWLNVFFLFSLINRPSVRCSPWASVLVVFLHMSFAAELSTELIPATCAELSGSCGCSSLPKVGLLSFMPFSAGPKY